MRVILRKDLKRKREGKKSEFRISGREIEPKKIQRFAQRYKVTEEAILDFNVGMIILEAIVLSIFNANLSRNSLLY